MFQIITSRAKSEKILKVTAREKTTTLISIRLAFFCGLDIPWGKRWRYRIRRGQYFSSRDWSEVELYLQDHNKPGWILLSHTFDGWSSAVWQTKSHNLAAVCRGMLHRWTLAFACQRTHGSDAVEIQIPSHQFHHNHYPISLKETTVQLQSQPKHCPVTISTHCPKHNC